MRDETAPWWGMRTLSKVLFRKAARSLSAGRRSVLGAIVVGGLLLTGCGELGINNWGWRQKLTVEMQVDDQIVSGSSVVSVLWWPNFFSGGWGGAEWHSRVEGEAVVVDLGEQRYLFALLSSADQPEYTANLATRVLGDTTERRWGRQAFSQVVWSDGEEFVVPEKLYPLLITFTDINDPTTVRRVDPTDLAAAFGPGVSLNRITLEITDEEMTEGKVEQLLPCLRSDKACVPLNTALPYGDPMGNIFNGMFWLRQ